MKETVELKGLSRDAYVVPLDGLYPDSHYVQATLYFDDCMSEKTDWFEVVTADVSPTPVVTPIPGVPNPTVPPDPLPDKLEPDALTPDDTADPVKPVTPTVTPTAVEPTPEYTDFQIPTTGPWSILILALLLGGLLGRIRRVRR